MTYDLLALQNADYLQGNLQQTPLGFGDPAQTISGVQRAVQRWLILFLTKKGSVVAVPDLGTGFLAELESGISDTTQIAAAFNSAAADALQQLQNTATSTDTASETITAANLVDLSVVNGGVSMTVAITTAAGTQRMVTLPLPSVPV